MRHTSKDSQMAPGLPRTWACLQCLKQRVDEASEQRRLHAAMLGRLLACPVGCRA